MKIITKISSVQAVILSSQLKEMLRNVNSQEISRGTYKPIKLVYHPREPFFVVKQVFYPSTFFVNHLIFGYIRLHIEVNSSEIRQMIENSEIA